MILLAVALTSIPTMAVPSEFEEEELEAKEYAEMSLDCGIKHAGRECVFCIPAAPVFWGFRAGKTQEIAAGKKVKKIVKKYLKFPDECVIIFRHDYGMRRNGRWP